MSLVKEGKTEKIWLIYFFLLGLLFVLEGTVLYPIIFILGKFCKTIYPTIKVLSLLWLYHSEFRGAFLLDKLFGRFIDLIYLKINPIAGKVLEIIGIPNRDTEGESKKKE